MADITTGDLRNIAVVGHGDTGKTTLVSACLYACRGGDPNGARRSGDRYHRLRRGRNRAPDFDSGYPRPLRLERQAPHVHRHSRIQRVPPRYQGIGAGSRQHRPARRRGLRPPGNDGQGVAVRQGIRHSRLRCHQSARSREFVALAHAQRDPVALRSRGGCPAAADRQGTRLQGRRRPSRDEGLYVRPRRQRRGVRRRHSRRHAGRSPEPTRGARRDGGRRRRGAHGEVLRRGRPDP